MQPDKDNKKDNNEEMIYNNESSKGPEFVENEEYVDSSTSDLAGVTL